MKDIVFGGKIAVGALKLETKCYGKSNLKSFWFCHVARYRRLSWIGIKWGAESNNIRARDSRRHLNYSRIT